MIIKKPEGVRDVGHVVNVLHLYTQGQMMGKDERIKTILTDLLER